MKNQIHTKSSRLIIALSVLFVAGCNGKKGDDPAPVVSSGNYSFFNPATLACTATGATANQILAAPSEATYTNLGGIGGSFNMKFCLQLLGDPNQITQWQNTGRAAAYYYSGVLALAGTLNISSLGTMGNCVLPAGAYQISSSAQGSYDPVTFTTSQFEAVSGNTRIMFQLRNGWTRDPNMDYLVDRLSLDIVALSVSSNGTSQVCNDIQGLFLN